MSQKESPELRPRRDVQKLLISSASRLTGELRLPGMLITPVSPGLRDRTAWIRMQEGATSRTAYVVSVRTRGWNDDELIIPTYDHLGDQICAYLSLLFGKRFDFHGAVESSGYFGLPDLTAFGELCLSHLPQNSHSVRADFSTPLLLTEAERIAPLFFSPRVERHSDTLEGASRFYWRALLSAESDPEASFLHLVTAGEILANGHEFSLDRLMDARMRNALERIERELEDGDEIAKLIRSQMRRIRRRFVYTIADLTDEAFFARGEAAHAYVRLGASDFIRRMGAAYDLRSGLLHSGRTFGSVIAPRGVDNSEIQSGKPIVPDKGFARALADSPTLVGLERIMRYALLRFAIQTGLILEASPERSEAAAGE